MHIQFNGQIFEQIKGTPMGWHISGLIAEEVMQRLENIIPPKIKAKIWIRYVDDTSRLSLPNAWPDHLEYDYYSAVSEEIDADTLQSMFEKYNISSNASKLVPLLSVKDALEHIHRPDCLVLDLRNAKEYNK
ncbi:unnamed protein product [Trichobilharzia regenti]|nr:unnamed protein product [Trichobilharzia regenti]